MAESGSEGIVGTVITELTKWIKQAKSIYAIVGFICIVGGLAGLFYYQAQAIETKPLYGASPSGGSTDGLVDLTEKAEAKGTANEKETVAEDFDNKNPDTYQCTATLTWTDEAAAGFRYTNKPDNFELQVTAPNGDTDSATGANTQGGEGQIVVNLSIPADSAGSTFVGKWSVNITLTDAGDQEARFISFFNRADTSNAFTLSIEWTYKGEKAAEKK